MRFRISDIRAGGSEAGKVRGAYVVPASGIPLLLSVDAVDMRNMPRAGLTPLFDFAHSQKFKAAVGSQLVNLIQTGAGRFVMLLSGNREVTK